MNSYSHNFAVCIGRQLGSGGRNVALAISRKMGIAFYDKEIPILGGLAGVHIPFFSGGYLDTESYLGNNNLFKIQSRTVEMLADKGPGVFVGRCADYILRDRPRVLSVFITATMEDRIERLSKLLSITPDEAEARIKECDRKRAEYYNYFTFKKWGDSSSYDLCLSTSLFGEEETADRIVAIVRDKILGD